MQDARGRNIEYLRVSITDRCNLRCVYCMPEDGVLWIPHEEILSLEEILHICEILAKMGARKIKVTGGEPLIRKGTVGFIKRLKSIEGIEKVTLTTNGVFLSEHLDELKEAGLNAINISLNSVSRENAEVRKTLSSIDKAYELGFPVKINCVPVMGHNDSELSSIAALSKDRAIHTRFIELMPIGLGANFTPICANAIIKRLERDFGKLSPFSGQLGNGPASYYSIQGFKGKIGFISAVSHVFCDSCNRLRLTSDGKIKACLAHDTSVDAKRLLRGGASDSEIERAVCGLIEQKPSGHNFSERLSASASEGFTGGENGYGMFRIGG